LGATFFVLCCCAECVVQLPNICCEIYCRATLIEAETAVRPPRGREQPLSLQFFTSLVLLLSPRSHYLTIATLARPPIDQPSSLILTSARLQVQRVSCALALDYTRSTSVSRQRSCLHHSTSPRPTLVTQQTTSNMSSSDDDTPLIKSNDGGESLSAPSAGHTLHARSHAAIAFSTSPTSSQLSSASNESSSIHQASLTTFTSQQFPTSASPKTKTKLWISRCPPTATSSLAFPFEWGL
jgi:hypothetical protein